MTIINRICPELADVIAIRLECKHCNATISCVPDKWSPAALRCPGCNAQLVTGAYPQSLTDELQGLLEFTEGLRRLRKLNSPDFRVRLEFDQIP
jgi:hypothetical protein